MITRAGELGTGRGVLSHQVQFPGISKMISSSLIQNARDRYPEHRIYHAKDKSKGDENTANDPATTGK